MISCISGHFPAPHTQEIDSLMILLTVIFTFSNPTDGLISAACHTTLGLLQKAITWNKWAHFNKEASVAGTYCASEHLVAAAAADSRQGCFLAFTVSRLFAELEAASHSEVEERFLSWQIS